MGSRRPWRAFEQRHRLGGLVRVLEIERGEAGWHPHFHVLLLVQGRPTEESVTSLVEDFRQRWCRALAAEGEVVPPGMERFAVQGHLLRRPERGIPAYLAKGHSDLLGRLGKQVDSGTQDARDAVREFQATTRQRRRIVVSQEAGWQGKVLAKFRRVWSAVGRQSSGIGGEAKSIAALPTNLLRRFPKWGGRKQSRSP